MITAVKTVCPPLGRLTVEVDAMQDLKARLKNRSDWRRLEEDLAVIERLVSEGEVSGKVKKLARLARRDLQQARADHSELFLRLQSPLGEERAAARITLQQLISAGDAGVYDPRIRAWRKAAQVLEDARREEEQRTAQQEKILRFESELADAASDPSHLRRLMDLLAQAEAWQRQDRLTFDGQAALVRAREAYALGCQRHRELTLNIRHGTLKQRFDALGTIKDWITAGESWILDAPDETWRPAEEILHLAEKSSIEESNRLADQVIHEAQQMAESDLRAALQDLYPELDVTIPYLSADRARLKATYSDLYQRYRRQEEEGAAPSENSRQRVSQADLLGYKMVRETLRLRMQNLVDQSAAWLTTFFPTAITPQVQRFLDEAASPDVPAARKAALVDMAVQVAENALENSIEIPEAMIHGAVILNRAGAAPRARDLLKDALQRYQRALDKEARSAAGAGSSPVTPAPLSPPDEVKLSQRLATCAFLLGAVEYGQRHRLEGYRAWQLARNHMAALYRRAGKEKTHPLSPWRSVQNESIENIIAWYEQRLTEMERYAAQTFEDVFYDWMGKFDLIDKPDSIAEFEKILLTQFQAKQTAELRVSLRTYLQSSQNVLHGEVYWSALVTAAFYEVQNLDYLTALEHLNQARIGFQNTHRGAVVRWLMGLIEWHFPSRFTDAARHWEESIEIFTRLARQGDQDNRPVQQAWYETQVAIMRTSLVEWLLLIRSNAPISE